MKENWELVEGNGYYNIMYDKSSKTYCVYDVKEHCYLDDTTTTDIQCAEKTMENLSEDLTIN